MSKRQFKFGGRLLNFILHDDADKSVFYEVFEARDYQVLERIIKVAKSPILDLGAHKGFFSLYAAVLNPDVKIFAFEPESANFAVLKEHLKINKIDNVVAKNLAVASEEGQRELFLSDDSHNHSLLNIDNAKTSFVQATTLEKIFEKNNIAKCSLVKIDVEGAEFEILENLSAEVFQKVDNFYVEYHKYTDDVQPEVLVKLFSKNGFKVKIEQSRYDKRFGFILAGR